jgi:hypothetical protein
MPYSMHRIFCAAPIALEEERLAFHDEIGAFNEEAMPYNILFVPVTIVLNMANLARFAPILDDNIETCRYYVQVLGESWQEERGDFKRLFDRALHCAADPNLPMQEVVLMSKAGIVADGARVHHFRGLETYRAHLRVLFSEWLESLKGQA